MGSIILFLVGLLGILLGAGYAGGYMARYQAPDRSDNVGFFCGVAGGMVVIVVALAMWWGGSLHFSF
jgi:hypothetical protein